MGLHPFEASTPPDRAREVVAAAHAALAELGAAKPPGQPIGFVFKGAFDLAPAIVSDSSAAEFACALAPHARAHVAAILSLLERAKTVVPDARLSALGVRQGYNPSQCVCVFEFHAYFAGVTPEQMKAALRNSGQ